MDKSQGKIPEKVKDITGAWLTPGKPETCQGNGEHKDFECCCDECNWLMLCCPDFD